MTDRINFTVELKELQKCVNYVRNALGNSKTDLAVMVMRVEVKGDTCTLFAFDKEVFARVVMPIKKAVDSKEGAFAVMGAKMEKLITTVNSENVAVSVDGENMEVVAGYLTVNFELYDEALLRMVQTQLEGEAPGLTYVEAPRLALEEGLSCAKSCTTSDSVRPDVNHAELRGGRILSSDGRKIMVYVHKTMPEGANLKVPAPALAGIIGALKNIDAEKVQVGEGKSYFYVRAGAKYLAGVRKIERSFPQVESWITTAEVPSDTIQVDKVLLEGMVAGVSLGLASDDVRVEVSGEGKGSDATLEVATSNALGRRSHERASCGRQAEMKLSFPVSYKHVADTLSVFKGDSIVDMMILDTKKILMVKDRTEDREVLTAIPFRTDEAIAKERKEREAALAVREAAKAAESKKSVDLTAAAPPVTA